MSEKSQQNNWDLGPEEAKALQERLGQQLLINPLSKPIKIIAGADISFNKYEKTVYAGIVLLDLATLKPYAHALAIAEVDFPYIPGLLSFREIPALLKAWEMLENFPDVTVLDGHGIAHPRRMGIATHFGIVTGTATMGIAKKKLFGKYTEPSTDQGEFSPLEDKNEIIGYVYRSKKNVKPVFVSPGHKVDFQDALTLAIKCSGKYRIPEPTRQAHLLVNQLRRGELSPGFKTYPSSLLS